MAIDITLNNLRGQYLNVLRPRKNNLNGNEEYSAVILIPKNSPQIKELHQKMMEEANSEFAKEKIWKGPVPNDLKFPIKDTAVPKASGNLWEDHEIGHYLVTAKLQADQGRPSIVDQNLNDIFDPSEIYSGAWFNWGLRAQAYNHAGNIGITLKLQALQKIKDDVPIGYGPPSVNNYFGQSSNPATVGNQNPAGHSFQQQQPNMNHNSLNQNYSMSSGNQFPNLQQNHQQNLFNQQTVPFPENPLNQVGQSMNIDDNDLPF